MSAEDTTNLANLPADIIRRILKECTESLESIRLFPISPRWKTLVRERILTGKHLVPIDSVLWSINSDGNAALKLWFHPKYRKYLGVEDWLSSPVDGGDGKPSDLCLFECDCKNAGSSRIPQIFRRCSTIGKLELDMDLLEQEQEMMAVENAIEGVHVLQLVIPFSNGSHSTRRILELLHTRWVHQLVLTAKDFRTFTLALDHSDNGLLYAAAARSNTSIEVRVEGSYSWHFPYWSFDRMVAHCEEKKDAHLRRWKVRGRLYVQRLCDETVRVSIIVPS